jgi:hypothetical protein
MRNPLPFFLTTNLHAYPMHRVFISYHHKNDQYYKEELIRINQAHQIFIDGSVSTREIDESLPDQTIRRKIRDEYLAETTVTILLAGTETKYRKHVDWELYSSMHDGSVNKKSGILVINLPSVQCSYFGAAHAGEKERVYPDCQSWTNIDSRAEYERRYPHLPKRITDNLLKPGVKISVVPWGRLTPEILGFLIDGASSDRLSCDYDLSEPMRRSNHNLI